MMAVAGNGVASQRSKYLVCQIICGGGDAVLLCPRRKSELQNDMWLVTRASYLSRV